MKKLILTVFVAMLAVFVMPGGLVSANGVDGEDRGGSSVGGHQPGDRFNITDPSSGEVYNCVIMTINDINTWRIDCGSTVDGKVFTVFSYLEGFTVQYAVSMGIGYPFSFGPGDTVEALAVRKAGIAAGLKNAASFGNPNALIVIRSSDQALQVALTQTASQARAMTQSAIGLCMNIYSGWECSINENTYYQAVNAALASQRLSSAGFQGVVAFPMPAVHSIFPPQSIPLPSTPPPPPEGDSIFC